MREGGSRRETHSGIVRGGTLQILWPDDPSKLAYRTLGLVYRTSEDGGFYHHESGARCARTGGP